MVISFVRNWHWHAAAARVLHGEWAGRKIGAKTGSKSRFDDLFLLSRSLSRRGEAHKPVCNAAISEIRAESYVLREERRAQDKLSTLKRMCEFPLPPI